MHMSLMRILQDNFSRHIAPPLLRSYQFLRPARRGWTLHFDEGLRFRASSENWSVNQKEQWILKRLREVMRHAGQTSPYYAEVFQRIGFGADADFDFGDFAKLPPLERGVLVKSGDALIANDIARTRLRRDASGGSTGDPVTVWIGPEEMGWHLSSHRFFLNALGVHPGSRVAFFWGHNLDPGYRPSLADKAAFYARNERWFDCFRLSNEVLLAYHREMQQFQPDCIVAYAGAIATLAMFLKECEIAPRYPRRCILTGAEKLYPNQREVVEQVFGCPVFERYGSRDAGVMGYQLPSFRPQDFIVDWCNVLLEPETAGNESEILITKLHADGMPMIRYRTGDVGLFPEGSKPGYPALRLCAVIGRNLDSVRLPSGALIHSIQFPHMFKDFPVREFMVIQSEDYSVEVQIVPTDTFADRDRDSIRRIMEKNLPGLPIEIRMVESVAKTAANKWRPVVSRVPR